MPQSLKPLCLNQIWRSENSLFFNYWPSGVIRIGLPVWKWNGWKLLGKKWLNRLQIVQFQWHRQSNHSVSSNFEVGRIPFSHYWLSGVIRIGLPVWKRKSWTFPKTKEAPQAANGPVWMAQAFKPPCVIQFWGWKNSLFPLLALWGNKNWPPRMKVKKLEIFQDKSGSEGCKWSSFNGTGNQTTLSHPILRLEEFPFPIIGPLG